MINPFISNNDSSYLFRKNYQFIAKPQVPSPPPSFSAAKLNLLHSKNPFNPPNPSTLPTYTPSRSLSNSRVGIINSPRDKPLLGKSRLLEEADGWKRQLQSQERGKLQAYGVEGLRYNAYTTFTPNKYESQPLEKAQVESKYQPKNWRQQAKFNDYYESYSKPIEVKPPKTAKHSGFSPGLHTKQEKKQPLPLQHSNPKKVREHFTDEINEQDYSQPPSGDKKQRNKYQLDVVPIHQQSQRQSKLVDMFGSSLDERFKQSMHHNSYASYYADDLVESKQSKFAKEINQSRHKYLQESQVHRFPSIDPPSIDLFGKTYYRIDI